MIYIDLTGLCGRKWTGVEIYGNILFKMMKEKFGSSQVCGLKVGLKKEEPQIINLGKNRGRFYTEYFLIPRFLKKHKNDCVIFPVFPPSRMCWMFSKNMIPVIHDVVPWKFADTMSWKARILIIPRMKAALKNAKKIITVSETEKQELKKLNQRPEYLVINNAFEDIKAKSIFEKLNVKKKCYLLSVSTLEPRKNFDYVLKIVDKLFDMQNDLKIVVVGRLGWGEITYAPRNKNSFVFSGYVSDDELRELYKNAALFITLPIDEGFGRTPVEAALQKLPVVVSDIPIFHEVLGDNCMYLPLNDVETAVSKLKNYLNYEELKIPDLQFFEQYSFESVKNKIPYDFFSGI